MRIDLSGKSALVTGSTQGIGLAIVEGLASAGARVGVNGRSEESVGRAVDELRRSLTDADVVPVVADVATDDGFAAAVEAMPDVDVLVNSLGIFESRPALEITDDEWRRYFEVNVLAAVRLTRHHLPPMSDRGWGRILYIASDSAVVTPVEMIHYGMSKTALLAVSRGFAKEAAGTGVTVNSVIAGPTHTGGVEDFVRSLVGDELPWDEAERDVHAEAPAPVTHPAPHRACRDRGHGDLPQLAPRVSDHRRRAPRRRWLRRRDPALTAVEDPAQRSIIRCMASG